MTILAWPSIFIGLCEVATVIQRCRSVFQRRVQSTSAKNFGASWEILGSCKAGQQTFPVQDVVGQSVAILQVVAAMDALKMKDLSSFCIGDGHPSHPGNLLMAI